MIALKRHAEALHELLPAEFEELALIQTRLMKLLHATLQCQKEYVSCYAETEHFYHVHFHVFAKPHDLPKELLGGKSFAILKVPQDRAVPKQEIADFCQLLINLW